MPVSLRLLGPASAEQRGHVAKVTPDRPASLLVYLASRGAWVSRRELTFLYRPDVPEADALGYLRKLVFRARRFPWAHGLEVEGDALRWRVDSDLSRFRAAVEGGQWERALAEYGGEFLAGWAVSGAPGIAEWMAVERAALAAGWLRCAAGRVEQLEAAERHEEAATLLGAAVRVDPFDEENLQRYMLSLSRRGKRGAALAAYDRFRQLLADEVGGLPLETTQALADAVRRGEGRGSPGEGRAAMAALPVPSYGLVGRGEELRLATRLLRGRRERLLCIVGLGGSGKTRLALEVAREVGSDFADGVAFLSFVGEGAGSVAARLLEAFGLEWEAEDAEAALVAGLGEKELLLVLDNFEDAVEAAPLLARLLASAPRLAVLVTSREALRLSGERVLELTGLEVPQVSDERRLERFGSVQLFTQRAARAAPGFRPSRDNLREIAAICRRLEGLPLAIELVASWSGALGPAGLLRELERGTELLRANDRDVAERHSSLHKVFDYTWERLGAREREVLPRLTVFRSGFDMEAARVAGCELEVLLMLVRRTLVRRVGEDRYVLHELVRQYAATKVDAPAAQEAAHSRHYCERLGRLLPELTGGDLKGALAAIAVDYPNLEAAWEHAAGSGDADLLDAALDALDFYLYYRGRHAAAAATFGRAADVLARREAAEDAGEAGSRAAAVRGSLLLRRAQHEQMLGRAQVALALAREGVALLERWGRGRETAQGRQILGVVMLARGEHEEAARCIELVLAFARRADDAHLLGAAHNAYANLIALRDGDQSGAARHYRDSLRAHRRTGNLDGIIDVTINLGATSFDLQEFSEAERLWEEAASLAGELGYKQREAVLQNNLGALAVSRGEAELAQERYQRSLSLRQRIGDRPGVASVLHNLGTLAHRQGDGSAAIRQLSASLSIYLELGDQAGTAYARSHLSRALLIHGDAAGARKQVVYALEAALAADSWSDLLGSLVTLALFYEQEARPAAGLRIARAVARLAAGSEENVRSAATEIAARLGAAPGAAGQAEADVGVGAPTGARELAARELAGLRAHESAAHPT